MDINIKSIHFDATDALKEFVEKKVNRLARRNEVITTVDVTLGVIKPETSMNKEAAIRMAIPPHADIFASKVADTFEEAVDAALDALNHQLDKLKVKK